MAPYSELLKYKESLANYVAQCQGDLTPVTSTRVASAREKLRKLTRVQFVDLSIDVYDELQRRVQYEKIPNSAPDHLQPENGYHPKRNHARQKLAALPNARFKDLVNDVMYEIDNRTNKEKETQKEVSKKAQDLSINTNLANENQEQQFKTPLNETFSAPTETPSQMKSTTLVPQKAELTWSSDEEEEKEEEDASTEIETDKDQGYINVKSSGHDDGDNIPTRGLNATNKDFNNSPSAYFSTDSTPLSVKIPASTSIGASAMSPTSAIIPASIASLNTPPDSSNFGELKRQIESLEKDNEDLKQNQNEALTKLNELNSTNEQLSSTNEELQAQIDLNVSNANSELQAENYSLKKENEELQNKLAEAEDGMIDETDNREIDALKQYVEKLLEENEQLKIQNKNVDNGSNLQLPFDELTEKHQILSDEHHELKTAHANLLNKSENLKNVTSDKEFNAIQDKKLNINVENDWQNKYESIRSGQVVEMISQVENSVDGSMFDLNGTISIQSFSSLYASLEVLLSYINSSTNDKLDSQNLFEKVATLVALANQISKEASSNSNSSKINKSKLDEKKNILNIAISNALATTRKYIQYSLLLPKLVLHVSLCDIYFVVLDIIDIAKIHGTGTSDNFKIKISDYETTETLVTPINESFTQLENNSNLAVNSTTPKAFKYINSNTIKNDSETSLLGLESPFIEKKSIEDDNTEVRPLRITQRLAQVDSASNALLKSESTKPALPNLNIPTKVSSPIGRKSGLSSPIPFPVTILGPGKTDRSRKPSIKSMVSNLNSKLNGADLKLNEKIDDKSLMNRQNSIDKELDEIVSSDKENQIPESVEKNDAIKNDKNTNDLLKVQKSINVPKENFNITSQIYSLEEDGDVSVVAIDNEKPLQVEKHDLKTENNIAHVAYTNSITSPQDIVEVINNQKNFSNDDSASDVTKENFDNNLSDTANEDDEILNNFTVNGKNDEKNDEPNLNDFEPRTAIKKEINSLITPETTKKSTETSALENLKSSNTEENDQQSKIKAGTIEKPSKMLENAIDFSKKSFVEKDSQETQINDTKSNDDITKDEKEEDDFNSYEANNILASPFHRRKDVAHETSRETDNQVKSIQDIEDRNSIIGAESSALKIDEGLARRVSRRLSKRMSMKAPVFIGPEVETKEEIQKYQGKDIESDIDEDIYEEDDEEDEDFDFENFNTLNPDNTLHQLLLYLEHQTVEVINAIQKTLGYIRNPKATKGLLREGAEQINLVVKQMAEGTSTLMNQSRYVESMGHARYVVEVLEECVKRMEGMYDDDKSKDGEFAGKNFKQRSAGIAFDVARSTKELVKTVEEASLRDEIAVLDSKLRRS
ncbi:Spa2 protein [Martiniozyma asiatica (nom. inval.)]|nr:Spa2 protein [Martiniozyma asiatica]